MESGSAVLARKIPQIFTFVPTFQEAVYAGGLGKECETVYVLQQDKLDSCKIFSWQQLADTDGTAGSEDGKEEKTKKKLNKKGEEEKPHEKEEKQGEEEEVERQGEKEEGQKKKEKERTKDNQERRGGEETISKLSTEDERTDEVKDKQRRDEL